MPALGAQSKDRWGAGPLAVNHTKENEADLFSSSKFSSSEQPGSSSSLPIPPCRYVLERDRPSPCLFSLATLKTTFNLEMILDAQESREASTERSRTPFTHRCLRQATFTDTGALTLAPSTLTSFGLSPSFHECPFPVPGASPGSDGPCVTEASQSPWLSHLQSFEEHWSSVCGAALSLGVSDVFSRSERLWFWEKTQR